MPLAVDVTKEGKGTYVLTPIGSIDSDTHSVLEEEIANVLSVEVKTIILDMCRVTYVTSLGISVIVKTDKLLEKRGAMLLVINLPAQIKKVFDIIKALPRERIYSTREELDAYLIKMQENNKESKPL